MSEAACWPIAGGERVETKAGKRAGRLHDGRALPSTRKKSPVHVASFGF